jgi:hypothetical protein
MVSYSKKSMLGNPKYSNRVYMLKQAMWVWYARLKTFLLDHGYVMEGVDKTLFTLKIMGM